MARPTLTLSAIHDHGGSQDKAFEALCYFLFCLDLPKGVARPQHFSSPDGGCETKVKLPDSRTHAMQAKFILDGLGEKWSQLDKSVRSAMKSHPDITDYSCYVACDLTPQKAGGKKSLAEAWEERKSGWKTEWKAATGADVEFHFVGLTDIVQKLMTPQAATLAHWFFGEMDLSLTGLQEHLDAAAEHAGKRFRPAFHVETPFLEQVDAFRLAPSYRNKIEKLVATHDQKLSLLEAPLRQSDADSILDRHRRLASEVLLLFQYDCPPTKIKSARETARLLFNDLASRRKALGDSKNPDTRRTAKVLEVSESLAEELSTEGLQRARWACSQILVATGKANTGKTHGLLERAKRHLAEGSPAIFVEAAHLQAEGNLLSALARYLRAGDDERDLLDGLQFLAQASGTIALLVVDGLNESGKSPGYWQSELRRLPQLVRGRNRVRIVVSMRSEFVKSLVPAELGEAYPWVEAQGFEGFGANDLQPLVAGYGLTFPTHGLLPPVYWNPYLLHLLCTKARDKGQDELPIEHAAVRDLVWGMVDDVNALAANSLHYPKGENWIRRALEALARLQLRDAAHYTPLAVWTANLRQSAGCSADLAQRIARECIDHGLVLDYPGPEPTVRFSFERLRDVAMASLAVPRDSRLATVFRDSPLLTDILEDEASRQRNLGALVAICSEFQALYREELPALLPEEWNSPTLAEAWLSSLLERAPGAASASARDYMAFLLADDELGATALLACFGLAVVDLAPFDSAWLDTYLRSLPMSRRDPRLNEVLTQSWQDDGLVTSILDSRQWGRSAPRALAWLLASCNRSVRDRATLALVASFDGNPSEAVDFALSYLDIDDDYVAERAMAVACGVMLRSDDADQARLAAEAVFAAVFATGAPRPNALLLLHAKAIVERGRLAGWTCPEPARLGPPQGWQGYAAPRELAELEREWGHQGGRGRDWTWHSLAGGGDFDRYIIGTNSTDSDWQLARHSQAKPSQRQLVGTFLASLDQSQRDLAEQWKQLDVAASGLPRLRRLWAGEPEDPPEEIEARKVRAATARAAFIGALQGEARARFQEIEPFFLSPSWAVDALPSSLLRRLTVEEFLRIRYTPAHLAFDESPRVSRRWRMGEPSQERIGKKHQWIAWHRAVAAVDWTHPVRGDFLDREPVRSLRDLDPTIQSPAKGIESLRASWAAISADFGVEGDHHAWAKSGAGIPSLESLLAPTLQGTPWLMVSGDPGWTSEEDPDGVRRQAFWKVQGYFVRNADLKTWDSWASGRNFYNSAFLDDGLQSRHAFLGEFASPWHDEEARQRWEPWQRDAGRPPCPVEFGLPCGAHGSELAKEWTGHYTTRAPSSLLTWRGLRRDRSLTAWLEQDDVVMLDPGGEHSCLLIRREALEQRCAELDATLVWIIIGERFAYGHEGRSGALPDRRWSGYAVWTNGAVESKLAETKNVD